MKELKISSVILPHSSATEQSRLLSAIFCDSGAAKTKGESFTYKVRTLLQQIILCIPDFSIRK